jgi:hypothetical protein
MHSDIHGDPETRQAWEQAVTATVGVFEWLAERGLYPVRDKNGGLRLAGSEGEGLSAEFVARTREYAPVIGRILRENETPLGRAITAEALDRYEEGRG